MQSLLDSEFGRFALLLLAAAGAGALATKLRQPLIIAFIIVGVIFGPVGLNWSEGEGPLDLLATTGIAVLLFLVGLKLDLGIVRHLGPVALATGLGQVVFTSVIGAAISLGLGFSAVESVYIAIALTFSSTIIIVKLLSDKREIDSLHGRIAVGFLIVQDLVVIVVMIVLSAFNARGEGAGGAVGGEGAGALAVALGLLMRGAIFLGLIGLAWWFVIPRLVRSLSTSREALTLFAIAWAVALAAAGDAMGFSKEVGAFLAGLTLASTQQRDAIAGRLTSLRDFLLLFFFVKLGADLELDGLGAQVLPAVVLSLFVLIGNPLIVMVIMGAMGYRKRTGFLAGLTVAQISEFSLIFTALGVSLGHIGGDSLGLVTLVGILTIGASTYMILYSGPLYERLAPALGVFEFRTPFRESDAVAQPLGTTVAVVGLGRFGRAIVRALRARGVEPIALDFDPAEVKRARSHGVAALYADAEDPEFVDQLPLATLRWIICTPADPSVGRILVDELRERRYEGTIGLTVHFESDAARFKDMGDRVVVLRPFESAGEAVAQDVLATLGAADTTTEASRPHPER